MATLPVAVSLRNVADNSAIGASDHRNNYSDVQTFLNDLRTLLAAGSSGQVLSSGGGSTVSWAGSVELPWLIDVDVFPTAIAQTNFDTITVSTIAIYNGYKSSSAVQNDEISFDVVLAAGTWTVELIYVKDTDGGIYSVQFDTVEKGTVDGYAAATAVNSRSSVAGIAVAATAKVRLKLKMATKNASSSNYRGRLQHIQLRRTA